MNTPGRRTNLDNVAINATTHAGLWLDKYLKEQTEGGGENAKKDHFEQIANNPVSDVYPGFFTRWQQSLEQVGAIMHKAQTQGRLAMGLGGESVLETSITLHRTYGTPYIPGSALKGLAARYARTRLEKQDWGEESKAYKVLFGTTAESGYITFFDALYIPGSAKQDRPLALDVITVHHPDYYGGKDSAPADWDSPIPVSFLSATGSYLIALHGAANWVEAAFEILELALTEEGIGAKTSSGYGRMVLERDTSQKAAVYREIETYDVLRRQLLDTPLSPGQCRGTLVRVKGSFGFINPGKGGRQEFVHESQIRSGKPLREGQVVEYRIGMHQGKPQAQDVEILLEPEQ